MIVIELILRHERKIKGLLIAPLAAAIPTGANLYFYWKGTKKRVILTKDYQKGDIFIEVITPKKNVKNNAKLLP